MLFDTHCHLDADAFDADRDAVFARAHAAGVTCFLNPAYDRVSSARAAALAATREDVWAAVGIHPNSALDAKRETDCDLCDVYKLASYPRVVAIGEIGLDYHWDTAPHDVQQEVLIEQLSLAQKTNLPVVIHCRNKGARQDCYNDLMQILLARDFLCGKVLLHSFAGTSEHARMALDAGYLIGVGGPLTYSKAESLREIVIEAPLTQLVLETDSPYLAPQPYRGKRNEPAHVSLVAERLAQLRHISVEQVAETTTQTAMRFFGI